MWLVTLLAIRLVLALQRGLGLPDWVLAIVPLLFIYAPVALCRYRGADSWGYHLSIPAFRDVRGWGGAAGFALAVFAAILVPWVAGYHVYQAFYRYLAATVSYALHHGAFRPDLLWPANQPVSWASFWDVVGAVGPNWSQFPADMFTLVAYQVFFVAIPEEFFYRGYFQTRLNEVHARAVPLFGTHFGVGLLVANLFFAFGHSVVDVQWWHFATFFPGLVFGWMRERSKGVLAGALFHALCNVSVHTLDVLYGVR